MTFDNNWLLQNDGGVCGCLPVCPPAIPRWRRFSPVCRLVDVGPANPQVYFRVAPSYPLSSHALTFSQDRVYMEVRRKGREDLLATYNVWRRDANGDIGFYFDDDLFSQPPGYYFGDVFIDCEYCFTVQLRLPRCDAVVTGCYTVAAMETCGEGICSVIDPAGIGMVGGGECPLPAAVTDCGTIAPFFELFDPVVSPTAPCAPSTICCFKPDPVGSDPAG